ncbi:MAG TPA: hypothetical protein VGB42_01300 [Candidatus Thermoplasmatota archaeon]
MAASSPYSKSPIPAVTTSAARIAPLASVEVEKANAPSATPRRSPRSVSSAVYAHGGGGGGATPAAGGAATAVGGLFGSPSIGGAANGR